MKLLDSINNLFKNRDGTSGADLKKVQFKKVNTLLLIAATGVLVMVIAGVLVNEPTSTEEQPITKGSENINQETSTNSPIEIEERALSRHLEEVLNHVAGVGQVVATVNLSSSSEQEYAINTTTSNRTTEESDQGGGTRTVTETNDDGQLVLVRGTQSGSEEPVVIKQYKPEINGVLVVAEGVNNVQTKVEIIRAVETLLNIPAHKVTVLPKESR